MFLQENKQSLSKPSMTCNIEFINFIYKASSANGQNFAQSQMRQHSGILLNDNSQVPYEIKGIKTIKETKLMTTLWEMRSDANEVSLREVSLRKSFKKTNCFRFTYTCTLL